MRDTHPSEIKILHQRWRIVAFPAAYRTDARGWADFERFLIGYCESLPEQALKEVILHEIIHTINFALQLEDGAEEESIAHRLAVGLRTVFVDNPDLAAWISC